MIEGRKRTATRRRRRNHRRTLTLTAGRGEKKKNSESPRKPGEKTRYNYRKKNPVHTDRPTPCGGHPARRSVSAFVFFFAEILFSSFVTEFSLFLFLHERICRSAASFFLCFLFFIFFLFFFAFCPPLISEVSPLRKR